jgi:hypothetical protein
MTEPVEVHVLARAGHDIVKEVIVCENVIDTGAVGGYLSILVKVPM